MYPSISRIMPGLAKETIAEGVAFLTFCAYIVDINTALLHGADQGVVAVNGSGDTGKTVSVLVASANKIFAGGQFAAHFVACLFGEDWSVRVVAGHFGVKVVLSQWICISHINQSVHCQSQRL